MGPCRIPPPVGARNNWKLVQGGIIVNKKGFCESTIFYLLYLQIKKVIEKGEITRTRQIMFDIT